MPRYLIERTFEGDIELPGPSHSEQARLLFVENNHLSGVVWINSYILPDLKKSYCVYDAPTPDALRRAAQRNSIPVDRIMEVQTLESSIGPES